VDLKQVDVTHIVARAKTLDMLFKKKEGRVFNGERLGHEVTIISGFLLQVASSNQDNLEFDSNDDAGAKRS